MRIVLASVVLAACSPPAEGITFVGPSELTAIAESSIAFIGDSRLATGSTGRTTVTVMLERDAGCSECYRIERTGQQYTVTGGVPLGVQYGIAHLLELHGYRFHHPWKTYAPARYLEPDQSQLGRPFSPDVDQKRGLHLHTLHPTEAMHDFWVPSAKNLEGARRTIDFVVKNRGNLVSWYALDDLTAGGATLEAWRAHNRQILDFAKARGVKTSVTLQLFGKSNLQQSFDLIDDDTVADPLPELERRLHLLLDEAPFDDVSLSFGEFFKADPAKFVQMVDATYAAIQRIRPGTGVTAVIHVGNSDTLRVEYQGTRQLYYFLVRYANPAIVPWVHTVFYYNLYDDAGGAYQHDDFAEHRAFLEDKLRKQEPAGYYPESAYWVSWDNSVPTYLPVYVKSRHLELQRLAQAGRLRQYKIFSSGWEWGYWQTDVAALRMAYTLPESWEAPLAEQFAPFGEAGTRTVALLKKLGDVQYDALITRRLGPFLAGRDEILESGKSRGIFSQPDRTSFVQVLAMSHADRQAFAARVVEPFSAFSERLTELQAELERLELPADNPYFLEVRDGVAITAARARFVLLTYRATLARADGRPFESLVDEAEVELAKAETVVSRRRKNLWDPDPVELLRNHDTPTVYDYGYLREADTLCFWRRERAQLRNVVLGEAAFIPACVL